MTSFVSILALGLVLAAFAHGGPSASSELYRHAVARRGCTQEDAPALEIYLTPVPFGGSGEPAKPYLRIEIAWTDWARITSTSFTLVPLSRRGLDPRQHIARAGLRLAHEKTSSWLTGHIVLIRVEERQRVDGSYNVVTPDTHTLRGTFSAPWTAGGGGCG